MFRYLYRTLLKLLRSRMK